MKAMVIDAFGGPDSLHLQEMPQPKPQEHEVSIAVHYASVNPVDWKIREGYFKSRLPHQFPLILGWDAAGMIAEVGANVRNFKVGDAVYAYCRKPIIQEGTYAEYVCFDAAHVAHIPSSISFAEAASVPLVGLTAWQGLFDFCHLSENQSVLIHAGSGGVGSFAIQLAKTKDTVVYTTCSSKNHDYVRSLGADYAIDYTNQDFASAINEQLDVVFDTIGGETLQKSIPLVKKGGTLVSIAQMIGPDVGEKHHIRAGFIFVRPNGTELAEIARLIEQGKIKIPPITEMPFERAKEALELSRTGHTCGKIVLKIK